MFLFFVLKHALFRWTRQQTVSIMKEYKLKCKSYWLRHQPNLG